MAESPTLIGVSRPRIDSAEKVRGETRYTADMPPLAGLLHGRLVLSLDAHARISRIDTTAAKQLKNCEVAISGPWPPYHFLPGKLRTVTGNS